MNRRSLSSFHLFKKIAIQLFGFVLFLSSLAHATTSPSFSLDGQLSKADGTGPWLDPSLKIKLQILNPTEDCILYEELQTIDTQLSNGFFNIQVGTALGHSKRTPNDAGNTMAEVYGNLKDINGKALSNGSSCIYSPTPGARRFLRISLQGSDGSQHNLSPNLAIHSVPSAVVAETAETATTLQGKTPNQFLNLETIPSLTQTKVEHIFSEMNYPRLTNLLSSVQSSGNGAIGLTPITGNPSTNLLEGQFWYDSTAKALKFYDGNSSRVLSGNNSIVSSDVSDATSSNTANKLVLRDGSGNFAAGTITGSGIVTGTLQVTGGSPLSGKVLTSDGSGNATWQSAPGGFAGAVNINSTPYSITTSDSGKAFYYTHNANGVVNLPALSGVSDGFSITIKRDIAETLTVTPAGSDKFPGGVTTIEMQGQNIQSMTVMKLGSTWTVVNKTDECIVGQDCWTANSTGGMKQLYVGSYNGRQYFTTPGGCAYEPSGSSTTTPTSSFTPTCSGTDTVQKAWATTAPESDTPLNLTNATDGQTQSETLATYATYATANAAKYCENLDYAGYPDWYLPARQELALLYQNSGTLGGFLYSSYYWSSTEYSNVNAWTFDFNYGYLRSNAKGNAYYVRCVRRF